MSCRLTTEKYIEKARLAHGYRYDYSLTQYVNFHTKIDVICTKHGIFQQLPSDHRRGFGCSSCSNNKKGTTETFIEKANTIHGNYYSYIKTEYLSLAKKVIVTCPKHGEFQLTPRDHIHSKNGCSTCKRSKGEVIIKQWLIDNNIDFIEQKRFHDFARSRYDFYLPTLNTCIEYDGAQHFHIRHQLTRDKEKAQQRFVNVQKRDKAKTEYCLQSNIRLVRIHFKYLNKLKTVLNNEILLHTTISAS